MAAALPSFRAETGAVSPWLQALDPRSKLALVSAGAVVALRSDATGLTVVIVVAALLLLTSRVSPRRVVAVGRNLTPLIVLVMISWPLFYSHSGDLWIEWGIVRITQGGVLGGITTALRILALVYVLALLAATTSQASMISALLKLRMPYAWGLTISMSLRYIPTLYGLYQTVTEAQSARGWSAPRGNLVKQGRGYLPVLIAVLIGALRLSDQTAMALTARGFNSHQQRTPYRAVHFRPADWLILAISVMMVLVLVVVAVAGI
jgi:energy-coupling factor transport system permease protein